MVGESNLCPVSSLDDVEIGDDMPFFVPDKSRAGTARNLGDISCPVIPPIVGSSDKCYGRCRFFKQRNSRFFIGIKVVAKGLFGFNYTLKGPVAAPAVGVNPLSLLTPGLFREIFRRPIPKVGE